MSATAWWIVHAVCLVAIVRSTLATVANNMDISFEDAPK